jgi:hypothetical protein
MSMTATDAFLAEIRAYPEYVAACSVDPKRVTELEGLRRGLDAVERHAGEDPAAIDIFDELQTAIGLADLSMKERLLEVCRLFAQVRDAIKFIH